EALVVRDHGLDPRLLEHDLAHPDRVRIARAAPREVALPAVEPVEERAADRVSHGGGACRPRPRGSSAGRPLRRCYARRDATTRALPPPLPHRLPSLRRGL